MDEPHLLAAIRYVLDNPVRARLVAAAADWRWSSARTHLGLTGDDGLTDTHLAAGLIPDFRAYLSDAADDVMTRDLRRAESTGRPVGDDEFVNRLKARTGRELRRGQPGRPKGVGRDLDALSP